MGKVLSLAHWVISLSLLTMLQFQFLLYMSHFVQQKILIMLLIHIFFLYQDIYNIPSSVLLALALYSAEAFKYSDNCYYTHRAMKNNSDIFWKIRLRYLYGWFILFKVWVLRIVFTLRHSQWSQHSPCTYIFKIEGNSFTLFP